MYLSEVFSQLAYGELAQTVLGENSEGELVENKFAMLMAHVNMGLTALYKRFNLKEGRLTFPLSTAGNVYKLGVTDLHKVERVLTSAGVDLPLNDGKEKYSCFTPRMDTIRVPLDIVNKVADVPEQFKTDSLEVVYRANHPKLVDTLGIIDPETIEVELPYSHLEALLYFVASRVHNPIGMANEFHAGNSWASKYEAECMKLQQQNLEIDESNDNDRLNRNGWV